MNDAAQPPVADGTPAEAICSPGFAPLLRTLGLSVAVSSYQSGKLVLLRADGDVLNTHYCEFARPTGLALRDRRLAVGTLQTIQEFHDHPGLTPKQPPAGRVDACYLPLTRRTTGDIEVHELGYANDGRLWFINTRFSALCTLSEDYSFQVQWQPPFISALQPEDRCHLNGLGFIDGQPALATALGHGDSDHSWRSHRLDGGVLLDIPTNRIIAHGLCLPHSPRWHDGQLWLLNSGEGQLATVDAATGKLTVIAELPGFTRGLAFHGPYAFVATSAVRDSATETGPIPIGERVAETQCGLWVIDTRSGDTVAWLRFTQVVNMLFSVLLLPGQRFPTLITDNDEAIRHAFLLPPMGMTATDNSDLVALFEAARDSHRSGDSARAEALYRRLLSADPTQTGAYLLLRALLQEQGRHEQAIELMEQAVARQPESADLQQGLGLAQATAGLVEAAVVSWGKALLLDPKRVDTWQVFGQALRTLGRMPEAAAAFDRALALQPDHLQAVIGKGDALIAQQQFEPALAAYRQAMQQATAATTDVPIFDPESEQANHSGASGMAALHGRLGEALQGLGELDQAAAELEQAVELQPDFTAAWSRLGQVQRDRGESEQASRCFARVLKLDPDDASALRNLGLCLNDLGQRDQALTCMRRASELQPNNPLYLNSVAVLLSELGQFKEAETLCRRAIALDPHFADAYADLAGLLLETRRRDEALATARKSVELDPASAVAHNNLGTVLQGYCEDQEAIASFERALQCDPDFDMAAANLALSQLLCGDFDNGWRNYEYRLAREPRRGRRVLPTGPRWNGGDPNGKRLLLHAEQGLGDSIQFIRYARELRAAGAQLVVQCQRPLLRLFSAMPEVAEVAEIGAPSPHNDGYALLPSLPYLLREQVPDIPATVPYLHLPSGTAPLTLAGDALKIGISWAGNPEHGNDYNRSTTLDRFLPLAALAGVQLYSLQVGPRRDDLQSADPDKMVIDLGAGFTDFADTAAAMMALDLVIGVDSAVVHLAGALGRPVWTLLPFAPDWRWQKTREDSPWYPDMRLFRQPAIGDWDSVFAKVASELPQFGSEPRR